MQPTCTRSARVGSSPFCRCLLDGAQRLADRANIAVALLGVTAQRRTELVGARRGGHRCPDDTGVLSCDLEFVLGPGQCGSAVAQCCARTGRLGGTLFEVRLRFASTLGLLGGRHLELGSGLGEIVELLLALVCARTLQRLTIGDSLVQCPFGLVESVLGGHALGQSAFFQRRSGEVRRGCVSDGLESARNLVDIRTRLHSQILGVDADKIPGGAICLGQAFQGATDLLHVAERARRLEHELIVQRAQTVGERLRKPLRVQVFRQLRSPQRQDEIDQLVVSLGSQSEHARIDRGPVVHRSVRDGVGAQLLGELLLRQRPVIGSEKREIDSHTAVGDEVPACHLVVLTARAHADADGDRLRIVA